MNSWYGVFQPRNGKRRYVYWWHVHAQCADLFACISVNYWILHIRTTSALLYEPEGWPQGPQWAESYTPSEGRERKSRRGAQVLVVRKLSSQSEKTYLRRGSFELHSNNKHVFPVQCDIWFTLQCLCQMFLRDLHTVATPRLHMPVLITLLWHKSV